MNDKRYEKFLDYSYEVEFTHSLGGGNSNIFYCHPDPWGFMIQFDLRIFFKRVETQPPTRSGVYTPWNYHIPWKLMVGRWGFLLKWSLFRGYVSFKEGTHGSLTRKTSPIGSMGRTVYLPTFTIHLPYIYHTFTMKINLSCRWIYNRPIVGVLRGGVFKGGVTGEP